MDLGFLHPLYSVSGPVASVYLDTTRSTESAAKEIELRWRGLREELAASGADEETLQALDGVVGGVSNLPGPQGEALFAAEGRILAAHTLPRPPVRDRASWRRGGDPLELVTVLDAGVPHVVVAVDRLGADVDAYPAHGGPVDERSFSGATLHVQKVNAGGWSHKRYQRHSEEVWSENAAAVAGDVEEAVAEVSAAVVFVGGDERAIGKLREHLSERVHDLVVEVPGGRAEGGAVDSLREAVDAGLRDRANARHAEVLAELSQELGRDGRAVQGADSTAGALRTGQVRTLLLSPDVIDEPVMWASATDPLEVSTERGRLTDPDTAFQGPASALLLRAAQATDAGFTTLPDPKDATDGVAALLRFTMEE
ncbi:Vms1/Ankzf1 family peptidyl-tRNA hydrolase [Marinactinospora thermotolerans]|uniref:Peptide chain release factor 1 (ERF1) n=1 Tax=Marinactinospora thermotolerans DSM 45154 TaxID=1122192 RepID=A0A1T4NAI2_9ACTN|nr:Vms1/Ankzf1 family peptidyl-tRNA hydrolase [Marinactinospora thermotolerans]SJZ76279.1 hypothetical protein SAMN02745673_01362 [Marinactinospora thermotolerans DSM 45154]